MITTGPAAQAGWGRPGPGGLAREPRVDQRDRWLARGIILMAGLAALLTLLILGFLVAESWPLLASGGMLDALASGQWSPMEGRFGLAAMLAGTLAVTALAMAIATPLGLGAAIFMRFYAPRPLARLYRGLLELLAGIPSVVFGFWGLVVLVPLVGAWQPPGASLLAGGLVLALMILPLVALSADASLGQVPASYWQGGKALGLQRWPLIRRIMLPMAAPGIVAGMVLQTGRALGETMAVLMVTGNVVQWPEGLFAPVRALTSNIALEMAYATGDHRVALFASGLVLMLVTILLVVLATRLRRGAAL